jgi:hypothetical protein
MDGSSKMDKSDKKSLKQTCNDNCLINIVKEEKEKLNTGLLIPT